MREVYKAERQNLPPEVVFHGETIGRYTESVLNNIDFEKLTAIAYDIVFEGALFAPFIKEVLGPMIKTAVGGLFSKKLRWRTASR